ncbi:MAG: zinc protease [Sphingomonadales bacterium]|jgi:zinc protease|nr:zinc protease [Sphingomonadales bacterium]
MTSRGPRVAAAAFLVAAACLGAAMPATAAPRAVAKAASSAGGADKAPIPIIAADPAVRFGTTANGFRYAVMQNKKPAGAVSIRLLLKVGSFEEADDELGYAHFIEHMAFRSTKAAPAGVLDNPFAAMGVALGRDQNAFTTLESTIYGVDVPAANPEGLRKILDWMRSAVDGIVFTPAAVETERGVLISELQTRSGPLATAQRDVGRFQLPGFRSVNRDPGGSEASLRAATPARIQAFYDHWYRPENAFLVIVGDASADELEALAKQGFSGWVGRGAAGVRPAVPTSIPARGLDALIETGEAFPHAISSCRLGPKAPATPSPIEQLRADIYSKLWTSILVNRLDHLSASGASPLIGATVLVNDRMADARGTCFVAVPAAGKWSEALLAGQAELRRFGRDGPTQQELDGAIEQLQAPLRGIVLQADSRTSETIAPQIADSVLAERIFTSPDEALRTFDVAVAEVTPADIKKAFDGDWSGAGPVLVAMGPSTPSREQLLGAWSANEAAAPPAAYADREAVDWPYRRFGHSGRVDRREVFADFVRLHFRNGTILNFKRTSFSASDVEIRVRFGRGESGLGMADRAPAEVGVGLFAEGGLGKLTYEQIGSAFASTSWKVGFNVAPTAFVLSGNPLGDQLQGELQLLAAYMTDPGFRPDIDTKLPTVIDFVYRLYRTEPMAVAADAMEQKLFPGQGTMPLREVAMGWRADDFARMLKPALTGSPVEVTIVGDVAEEDAKAAVASTFGALPTRAALPANPDQAGLRRYPAQLPREIDAFHQGPGEKAAAIVMWPLYVAVPERRKEEHALSLLSGIFRARLFHETRVRLGKVYEADVVNPMPDFGDEGSIVAQVRAAPADLDQLIGVARRIAAELATGAIQQSELDQARQLLVADRVQAQSRNSAWAGVLSDARDNPHAVDDLLLYPSQMAALTLDDVRAAAASWLKREPLVVRSLPQPPGPAAATH